MARGAGGMGKGPASSTDVCKTSSVSEASSNSGIPTQGLDFQTCRASIDTRKSPPGWYHRLFWEGTGGGQGHWDTTTACHHLEEAEACYPAWERAGWGLHYIQLLRGKLLGGEGHTLLQQTYPQLFAFAFVPRSRRSPMGEKAELLGWDEHPRPSPSRVAPSSGQGLGGQSNRGKPAGAGGNTAP